MADTKAVPEQWKAEYGHKAGTPNDYHRFYTFNWKYLFDLAAFASEYRPHLANATKYMRGNCLDFGCGIGTVSMDLARRPEVTRVDALDPCIITADFLRFRAQKHNLPTIHVLDPTRNRAKIRSTREVLEDISTNIAAPSIHSKGAWGVGYDFIYARDVLEHCWDRVDLVKVLCDCTAKGGVLVEATPIEQIMPEDGYENVRKKDYDLWDVLQEKGFERIEREYIGGMCLGHANIWRKKA
jgi:2-polyprenyl-3-methyl-5-hydroxy-6-metoxy-1,4-benzoquinol methylase